MLDGNFGMNRQDQQVTGPDFGENLGLDLGIPGTNGTDIRQSGLPHFDIPNGTLATGGTNTNLYDIGTTPNWMPLFRKERSYTFSSALTWLKGRHQVRTGLDIVHHGSTTSRPSSAASAACAAASSSAASPPATPGYIPQVWNELGGLRARPDLDPAEGRAARGDDGAASGSTGSTSPTAGTCHEQADPEPRPALRDVSR